MQLFVWWKKLHLVVPMEKHVAENDMEEDVSLKTVLDVIRDTHQQKCRCTFEHICASLQQQEKDISTHAVAALLEQAVTEKVVKKRVINNIPLYQMLDSFKQGKQKLAISKVSSLVLSQLSDAVVSTLGAAGSTDSKRSLSLKCIAQKVSSERKIHVPEDFDWSRNMIIVCKQLVTRGVLRKEGTQYHLVLGTGHSKLSTSFHHPEVTMEPAGITQGQKRKRVRFSKIVDTENKALTSSSGNESKIVSGDYHVIGEVYTSEETCKPCNRNGKDHDTMCKAVVKRKTRTLLNHAQGVSLTKNLGQMPRSLFGGKNLRRRKFQLQSSGGRAVDAAVEPFNHKRKLLRSCRQYSKIGSKQADMKADTRLADRKHKTLVKDANSLSSFCAEKWKQSSQSPFKNISEVVPPNEGSDDKRHSMRTRRSIQNHALSCKFVPADGAVATSVINSHSSVDQPVVTLRHVELQPVSNDSWPVSCKSNASTVTKGKENNGDSLGNTRKILSYQPASASEVYGNTFNEVNKT